MAIIAKDTGGGGEPIPVGVHQGACVNVIDLGMQPGYQGKPAVHQIAVVWEIDERRTEGENVQKRFTIAKQYTLSLHEKANLRADLESWRGRPFTQEELAGFDVEKVRGVPCQINVVEGKKADGSVKYVVAAVIPPPKGAPKFEPEQMNYVPQWVTKLLGKEQPAATVEPPFEDDIPF